MKTITVSLIFSLFLVTLAFSQEYLEKQFKGYTNPDELVTMSANLPFNQAIELLNKVSESTTGKKIISTVDSNSPIGIEIKNMTYDKALVIVVKMAGLMYEEKDDAIIIKKIGGPVEEKKTKDTYASVDSREVKISAVFFESSVTKSKQRGIDWHFLLSQKGLNVGGLLGIDPTKSTSSQTQSQPTVESNLSLSSEFNTGGFYGQATATFQFLENENLGNILASPNIIVRDREEGKIQIGSDFSVKQRDFAGNVIESFFSTGAIIHVTPYVYREDGVDYVLLKVHAERSSVASATTDRTEIRKTAADTQLKMLNGEETIIGGLFTNEETKVRTGIPFLKDLPWWFFGLRYIFGSDQTQVDKKELVILLKTELLPTLKERLAATPSKNPIKEEIKKQREKIKFYQFNQSQTSEN